MRPIASLRPGKDRTLDQNALWFAMYKRISEMTQIGDAGDARRYCKLHFGVQILLNEDAGFLGVKKIAELADRFADFKLPSRKAE